MSIKKNEEIFPECIFEEMFYIVAWNCNTNRNVGKTCRKILCYMHDLAYRWAFIENGKKFGSYD